MAHSGPVGAKQLILAEFLPYRLSVAANAVADRVAQVYRTRFGLRIPEWRVLAVVAEGAATQAELVEKTAMDKMTVSRAAKALVARGLLARTRAKDRRTLALALTPEGERLHAEVAPHALAIEAELLSGFTEAERAMLMALLARLAACARP
ncbi:MarR family winged helix-turn-helix transcriptional regulator [Thermaurantiacus tibetensis]|uniref:MarR family winged helix-turn-helix transcriptional regulator n=1 Tax=Thermaurantiacus tibetensis TaxID=2759035 RepID=UPI002E2ADC86|nr:MarR family transcriptional regulator [Thermaurantiacus tibetensis]